MKPLLFLLALFAFFSCACIVDARTTGAIKGTIVDSAGKPFPDVTIEVGTERYTTTKADGTYSLVRIFSGEQTLRVTLPGSLSVDRQIIIESGETILLNMSIEDVWLSTPMISYTGIQCSLSHPLRRANSLSDVQQMTPKQGRESSALVGKVVDEEGVGIPHASIRIVGTHRGAWSKPNGDFSIAGLQPTTLLLRVSACGYESVEVRLNIDGATEERKSVVIVCGTSPQLFQSSNLKPKDELLLE